MPLELSELPVAGASSNCRPTRVHAVPNACRCVNSDPFSHPLSKGTGLTTST